MNMNMWNCLSGRDPILDRNVQSVALIVPLDDRSHFVNRRKQIRDFLRSQIVEPWTDPLWDNKNMTRDDRLEINDSKGGLSLIEDLPRVQDPRTEVDLSRHQSSPPKHSHTSAPPQGRLLVPSSLLRLASPRLLSSLFSSLLLYEQVSHFLASRNGISIPKVMRSRN
jgi:hypothetical protein